MLSSWWFRAGLGGWTVAGLATVAGCSGESSTRAIPASAAGEGGEAPADAGESGGGRGGSAAGRGGRDGTGGASGSGGGSSGSSSGSGNSGASSVGGTGQAGTSTEAGRAGVGGAAGDGGRGGAGATGGSSAGSGGKNPGCREACDDGNPCTADACVPGGICRYTPEPAGSSGACRRCDGLGNEILDGDDMACGEIDCSARYTRGGDDSVLGTKTCFAHEPLTKNRCTPAGECRAPNDPACDDAPLETQPRTSCGACKTLLGCDGTTPGSCGVVSAGTPTGNTCGTGTCERAETCEGSGRATCTPGSPEPEICNDGVDQDCDGGDAMCPTNDTPEGAIDISNGGTFAGDLSNLVNDQDFSGLECGSTGGKDVFFEFALPGAEVVYFHTGGSQFDTVLRLFHGRCTELGELVRCFDDDCGLQSSEARGLEAGPYCLVLDQYSVAATNGGYSLEFVRTGRTGTPIDPTGGTVSSSTTNATNQSWPVCRDASSTAPDEGYFFTSCADQSFLVSANTCAATWDTVLYLRSGAMPELQELACNDDYCGLQSAFSSGYTSGPDIHWLIVDGFGSASGDYTLDYAIEPQ